ncbi:MAG: sigma 54-interacting transcriptional regulator [Polyangiales bacterium]
MMVRTDTRHLDQAVGVKVVARFYVEEPGAAPRVVELQPGSEARVGRGDDVEITVNDRRASRRHALIRYDGARVTVEDLASSNGTFVGAERVTDAPVTLAPGSLLMVGSTRLVLVPPVSVDAGEAAPLAWDDPQVVAVDPETVRLFQQARRLAASDLPVLLTGETGVGKEVVARALHRYSSRAGGPFVGVNCGSLPEGVAESELFGHERGSFTGATAQRAGIFESADGGVLLLDEIAELSPSNQARLLRALEERVVVRVGGAQPVSVDLKVIAATHRDLADEVRAGRFREDLYFRLAGATLRVPALRERPADIAPLARRILAERAPKVSFGPGVLDALTAYRWPGNVRELRNAIDSGLALCDGGTLRVDHLPATVAAATALSEAHTLRGRVDEAERREIVRALATHNNNQSRAARELGISRRALIYKMERYGLKPPPGATRKE